MSADKISKEQITKIARLARLEISEQEAQDLEKDLGEILEYVGQLSEISTNGVKATSQVHSVENIFRSDIKKESLKTEEIEAIAPDFSGGGFRVPKVI
jgi:aspartyl-tRNA(Asn)/glutamyl-tRNA(Gln) amidotransferase subunit C